ncbi:MAG: hypothetical protein IE934_07340 [Sphingopyxis sp.]|nr:hypothetical protein [Sphingopyxis sp.]
MSGPVYESQTRALAMPIELRNGPAPGAIVGQGLDQLGEATQRVVLVDRQRDRAGMAADRAVAFAQLQGQIDDELTQLKLNGPADAAGFEEKAATIVERRTDDFLNTLSDREVRNAFLPDVAQYRGRVLGNAKAYAIEKRADKTIADYEAADDIGANLLNRSPTGDNWESYQASVETRIGQMEGLLPADKIEELRRASLAKGAISLAEGLPADKRKILLDSGQFDTLLPADKLLALKSGTDVDLRREAAEQRALASQAKAEQREELATVEATLNAGTGKPQDWQSLADRYEAIGDTSKAVELRAKGQSSAAAVGYRNLTPAQLDQELAKLNAIETRNSGLTPSENALRSGLKDIRSTVTSLIGQSPMLAASYATGRAPPAPINWSDPASIEARRRSARAAANQYGQRDAKPLLPSEIEEMQATYRSPGGKAMVLDRVRLFGDDAASAARQISNDPMFAHLADLSASSATGRNVASLALQGDEILKTQKGIWTPAVRNDANAAWGAYAKAFSDAPALGTALYQTARGIYAYESADAGDVEQNGLDEDRWKRALDRAAGGDGRGRGGIIAMNGGHVIIPPDWTEQDFTQTIARAGQAEWTRAAQGRNAYVGGRLLTLPEIRKAVPVPMFDGRYRIRIGNGLVTNSEKRPWTFDINLLRGR